ncbi:MAG: hypothetical protein AAFP78_06890 [Pseudomonadota bacterium]
MEYTLLGDLSFFFSECSVLITNLKGEHSLTQIASSRMPFKVRCFLCAQKCFVFRKAAAIKGARGIR